MTDDRQLVLITGAAGKVGTALRHGLADRGWRLRLFDREPVEDGGDAVGCITADIRDDAAIVDAMRDAAAVVHLAGIADEAPFAEICEANIVGTYQVFDAARRAGVPRIVFASSNHAVGFTPRQRLVGVDTPIRPDTYYGVSKAFGEALARFYVDRFGLRIACLRIGSFAERPTSVRMLSTWLSPGDLVRLTDACLTAPSLTYAVVYGISANTRGWWDLAPGRAIGYEPRDDAEAFAADVLAERGGELAADDPEYAMLGGDFTTLELPIGP